MFTRHSGSIRAKYLSMLGLLLAVGIMSLMAVAANVHFKGGKNAGPTFSDQGVTLNSTGCLAGLGNEDVTIRLIATGTPTYVCTNPGGNQAPGINKKLIRVEGTQTIDATEIKNGNVCFNVTTLAPPQPTAKEAGCPNNNWSAAITDVAFKSARIEVYQGGKLVLSRDVNKL